MKRDDIQAVLPLFDEAVPLASETARGDPYALWFWAVHEGAPPQPGDAEQRD